MKRKYNLIRQNIDRRDYKICSIFNIHPSVVLPSSVDLRSLCPPIFNQGDESDCTANAGVAARMMLDKLTVELSRQFLYWVERPDDTVDSGCQMRDIGQALINTGVCVESLLPNDRGCFEKPNPDAYENAVVYKIKSQYACNTIDEIKQALALKQQPVMAGIAIYDSFESDAVEQTGVIPIPDISNESSLGGHAVCVVGYDDAKQQFICRNSWGESWGDAGYFYLPYEYFTQGFMYDMWVLQK